MIIEFEGRPWEWDPDADVTVKEATVLRLAHGMSVSDWLDGLRVIDERSWAFTYWLLKKRNGIVTPFADVDFPLMAFISAYTEAAKAAAEGLEDLPEQDPTPPPPPSPPDVPVSAGPGSPTTTTPAHRGQHEAPTGYSPETYAPSAVNTSSYSPTTAM